MLDIDPSLDGLVVRGDKSRLRQALINLTNNSIKYTREGEVRIRVDCLAQAPRRPRADTHARVRLAHGIARRPHEFDDVDRTSERDDFRDDDAHSRLWVRFEVVDTGIGIAEDKIGVIFMPFGQASTSSTREYGGTGLGLAITSNIVRALGGVISCKSALGRGTSMTLEIPLALRNRETADAAPPSLAHARSHPPIQISNVPSRRLRGVSVVANASLTDAVGRVARGAGARATKNHRRRRTLPHTAYQRATWARELCGAIRRRWCGGDADVVLVVEEGFIAPMWAEWHASYGDERLAPVIAVVGKKTHLRDDAAAAGPARDERRIDPARAARGAPGTRAARLRKPPRAHRLRRDLRRGRVGSGLGLARVGDRAARPPAPHDRDEDPAGMEAGMARAPSIHHAGGSTRETVGDARGDASRRGDARTRGRGGREGSLARGTGVREPALDRREPPANRRGNDARDDARERRRERRGLVARGLTARVARVRDGDARTSRFVA